MNAAANTNASTSTHFVCGIGQTIEVGTIRIHRFRCSIRVTDLTNAGKRGKRCEIISLISNQRLIEEQSIAVAAENLAGVSSFEDAVVWMAWMKALVPTALYEYEVRSEKGIGVEPAATPTIEIVGDGVQVRAELYDFCIKNLRDTDNDTTIVALGATRSERATFYAWVKANAQAVTSMTFGDVQEAMRAIGVRGHQFCAVD